MRCSDEALASFTEISFARSTLLLECYSIAITGARCLGPFSSAMTDRLAWCALYKKLYRDRLARIKVSCSASSSAGAKIGCSCSRSYSALYGSAEGRNSTAKLCETNKRVVPFVHVQSGFMFRVCRSLAAMLFSAATRSSQMTRQRGFFALGVSPILQLSSLSARLCLLRSLLHRPTSVTNRINHLSLIAYHPIPSALTTSW